MPTQPKEKKGPFGPAQLRLFKFILTHPGCTMAQIREDEFPDKTGNYVWNLISENRTYVKQLEIGTDLPDQFFVRIEVLKEVVDIKHYIMTGELKQKLTQTSFAFDRPTTKRV